MGFGFDLQCDDGVIMDLSCLEACSRERMVRSCMDAAGMRSPTVVYDRMGFKAKESIASSSAVLSLFFRVGNTNGFDISVEACGIELCDDAGTVLGSADIPRTLVRASGFEETEMRVAMTKGAALRLLAAYASGQPFPINYVGEMTCLHEIMPIQIPFTG